MLPPFEPPVLVAAPPLVVAPPVAEMAPPVFDVLGRPPLVNRFLGADAQPSGTVITIAAARMRLAELDMCRRASTSAERRVMALLDRED
jgi:hypothetical protein